MGRAIMSSSCRISTVNGLLLACYFVPTWAAAAWRIVSFPIRGLYDRANIAPAIFVSDHLQFLPIGTVRFGWLLAVAKLLVVAFLVLFAALTLVPRRAGAREEALTIALGLVGTISLASMVLAAAVGETGSQHLHATEALMAIGGLLVMLMDARDLQQQAVPAGAISLLRGG